MKIRTAAYIFFGLFAAGAYAWAVLFLPAFGNYHAAYGDMLRRRFS